MPISGRSGLSRMRFLSVADRELRCAARHKGTYRARWLTAALFFGVLVWLLWLFRDMSAQRAAPEIFRVYSILTFLYCVFISTARTADCISIERREGTLGLLFLTNLNSFEIIAGKFCSTALSSVYGLIAIFPMLALPLLMGGITLGWFGRTVLALLGGILSALAAGFLASVVCKRQFTAIAVALGLMVCLSGGLPLGAEAVKDYAPGSPVANWLLAFSPLSTLLMAGTARGVGLNPYWHSVAAVTGISLSTLALAVFLLAHTWRDRPTRVFAWRLPGFGRRSARLPSRRRAAFRRRLLEINPVFWLASPKQINAPILMALALVLTLITSYVAAPYFGRTLGAGIAGPVLGHLFSWLWTGLIIHALVLYYAAMSASQRLAEDKQSGALELLLSTPMSERDISRGLWLAYARKMFFPAVLVALVHFFFIWMCMVMASLDPPGELPPGATPGEIFWSALLNKPLRGYVLDWQFGFMLRIVLLLLLQLMLTWPTLGWVGRWLGLRMKHPGFAPITSLVLLIIPPLLLFTLACYLASEVHLDRIPERQFLPLMMWLTLGIGVGHCVLLSWWAATRLRRQLRSVALSRYEPLPAWRWRLPGRRAVRRFVLATVGSAAVVALLVSSYYGYQNWQSQRAWRAFQAALKQRGESLELSPAVLGQAPSSANFARSPEFVGLLSTTNRQARDLFNRLRPFDLGTAGYQGNGVLLDWTRQTASPLRPFVVCLTTEPGRGRVRNGYRQQAASAWATQRTNDAAAILQGLQPENDVLHELATAAARCPMFRTSTNRVALAVLGPAQEQVQLLERLHLLFELRACARLALAQNSGAAEDLLAGLRLAGLGWQFADNRSTVRVQLLLTRSLQPLWEGLSRRAWTGPQLAAMQHELTQFDLLSDYTNAVQRTVLAHIALWRTVPDNPDRGLALLAADNVYIEPTWQLQPRAWWFDNCIQLYNAGRHVIEQVDVGSGRIQPVSNWSDLEGFPLDTATKELLQQQSFWWGANPVSVAFAQTSVNQAILACALERFRLARGTYPATLEQLVPEFLARVPHDAVSGRSLIFQAGGAAGFILRGVGPNGLDDRNKPGSDDWLWTYSTNKVSLKK